MKQLINKGKLLLYSFLGFEKVGELDLPEEVVVQFERLYDCYIKSGNGELYIYEHPYPLHYFLRYLTEHKQVVLHGSNLPDIQSFEPRASSLFNMKPIKAVFASSDGIWPLFFASVNRTVVPSLRNICLSVPTKKGWRRFYYFSIQTTDEKQCYCDGTIYILPKESFQQGGIRDEWVCEQVVKPLAKISVMKDDFPFLNEVNRHQDTDSFAKTVIKLLIKRR
ncbi:hypothetical protein [Alkalihalobacillus sp. LMS39]|uniref:hypothetical protein n=1 Tax=Alkalihalobacillus sp. LMS39 TaxID=2924032 RepID=UPI001FB4DCD8|nr:hypothetical protein [Alkalihalobacillus sp. LMS39]UOE93487.1 hypothetical protein MM271_20200 [Alkalihalobacillus sp. LMS39]